MPTDEDMRVGLDVIQEDMARHQRLVGKEVTAEANRALASQTFESLERQWEGKQSPSVVDKVETPSQTRREIDGRAYRLTKEKDSTKFRQANPREQWFMQHAWPRVQLLLTKKDLGSAGDGLINGIPVSFYSWHERVMIAARWQQVNPQRWLSELMQLLDDSIRHFGDWRNDSKTIQVGG
jgi:hypothetical protein